MSDCLALQRLLELLTDYCERFLLKLNLDKCMQITFSRKTSQVQFNYSIQGTVLGVVSQVKDLGVILDSRLMFREHMAVVKGKAFKMLGYVIRTCRDFTSLSTLKTVYFSIVRSHLDYCSQIWSPTQKCASDMIEAVQRRFVRFLYYKGLVPSAPSEYHYLPCLEALTLQSLDSRRICSDLVLLYKIYNNNYGGLSIEAYLREPISTHALRSQRLLMTKLHCSSTLNRCVELFNRFNIDLSEFSTMSLSRARSAILDAVPNY